MGHDAKPRRQHLLGLLFSAEGTLSHDQIDRVLTEQASLRQADRFVHFGQVALDLGLVSRAQLDWALQMQERLAFAAQERDRLGYLLLDSGAVRPSQIALALERQKAEGGLLGELLVSLGYVTAARLQEVLDHQATAALG
ncbi:MAG: biosis protein MshE [Cyanobacteria bacterium RYN_339]|nr:biosis protein MshE [Cyanobacteria bacterium RYN_339]